MTKFTNSTNLNAPNDSSTTPIAKAVKIIFMLARTDIGLAAHIRCPNCKSQVGFLNSVFRRMTAIEIPRYLWTREKLIDELSLHLAGVPEIVTDDRGDKITVRKYYRRATELQRWIPIARPAPEYIIDISDLDDRLRKELLDEITSNDARQDVLKEAVGRIFENLNFESYHLSIARNLKVRLE